jgi:hypothetical protein
MTKNEKDMLKFFGCRNKLDRTYYESRKYVTNQPDSGFDFHN